MRLLFLLVAAAMLGCGCALRPSPQAAPHSPGEGGLIVTPEQGPVGTVALVNEAARYVVIDLNFGHAPVQGRRLSLYRKGLKVGEIIITGPHQNTITAGDLIAGSASIGDIVLPE
jgi:hypothetical protein